MDIFQRLPFKHKGNIIMVAVWVSSYPITDGLYVGISSRIAEGMESGFDVTASLPQYPLGSSEAFINCCYEDELLAFIEANKLGAVLPYTVQSRQGIHNVVAFDMDRLRELDPEGVAELERVRGTKAGRH